MNAPFAILAENNFGDTVPNGVAGPMGLFITALMVGALYLLMRSMNKRLRRLPESFPVRQPGGVPAGEREPADQVRPGAQSPSEPSQPAAQAPAAQLPQAAVEPPAAGRSSLAAGQPPAVAEASPAGAQPAPPDASA